MIEIVMDFCLGDDFNIKIIVKDENGDEDEKKTETVQERWDMFCNDPINQFYARIEDYITELKLTGELLLPASPNTYNGLTRLGYIDTKLIDKVISDVSGFLVDTVTFHPPAAIGEIKPLKIIRLNEVTGKYEGDAFFYQSNKLLNQSRGYPDIMNLVDWLDGFDQFLFNSLEHNALVGAFFYDCKMTGATEEDLKNLAPQLAPPKKGSVKLHNEKTEWDIVSPDLKAVDTSEYTRLLKNYILGAKGLPDHWFGEGSNTSLATAEAMGIPTMRMLKKEQKKIKDFIEPIALYVVHTANDKMQLFSTDDKVEVHVDMFDFERKDAAVVGAAFVQLVQALTLATSNNWVTQDKAKEICDGMLTRLGVTPDFDMKVEDIKSKNDEGVVEDIYKTKPKPFLPGEGE